MLILCSSCKLHRVRGTCQKYIFFCHGIYVYFMKKKNDDIKSNNRFSLEFEIFEKIFSETKKQQPQQEQNSGTFKYSTMCCLIQFGSVWAFIVFGSVLCKKYIKTSRSSLFKMERTRYCICHRIDSGCVVCVYFLNDSNIVSTCKMDRSANAYLTLI